MTRTPSGADALGHLISALRRFLAGLLGRAEDAMRPEEPMRTISSKDATLRRLASPHTTVRLTPEEIEQARAVEESAHTKPCQSSLKNSGGIDN